MENEINVASVVGQVSIETCGFEEEHFKDAARRCLLQKINDKAEEILNTQEE